jgi:hypothetical protein
MQRGASRTHGSFRPEQCLSRHPPVSRSDRNSPLDLVGKQQACFCQHFSDLLRPSCVQPKWYVCAVGKARWAEAGGIKYCLFRQRVDACSGHLVESCRCGRVVGPLRYLAAPMEHSTQQRQVCEQVGVGVFAPVCEVPETSMLLEWLTQMLM